VPSSVNEADDRFYVAPSTLPGAGLGLFARVPLKEGARLLVIGVLVPSNSDSDRCTAFADAHKFRVGDQLLIPLGFGAMVNHSSSPNLARVIDGDAVHLQLLRNVAEGEELFFTYSAYAQQRFGLSS
jgi:SET domain